MTEMRRVCKFYKGILIDIIEEPYVRASQFEVKDKSLPNYDKQFRVPDNDRWFENVKSSSNINIIICKLQPGNKSNPFEVELSENWFKCISIANPNRSTTGPIYASDNYNEEVV